MKFRGHILLLCCLCLVQCTNTKGPDYVFRVGLLVNEDHTWYKAFAYFGEILAERSEGKIAVEVYPAEQLGKESEIVRMIQAGVVEMTATGSTLNNWMEIAAFCEMPYLLKDSLEMKKLVLGPLGKEIERQMREVTGLIPLGYFQRGPRHLTSNRPIRHPDELEGLLLRVPNVPSFVTAWNAMGAKPTPMAFSEVFTSLQQGTIEAQENPFALIQSAGFAEVQAYINLTGHVMSWIYPVVGKKALERMPKDLQALFLEAAEDMQRYEHSLFIANEKEVQAVLQSKGMELVEVDKEAFADRCREALFESLSPAMQEVYTEFLESLP